MAIKIVKSNGNNSVQGRSESRTPRSGMTLNMAGGPWVFHTGPAGSMEITFKGRIIRLRSNQVLRLDANTTFQARAPEGFRYYLGSAWSALTSAVGGRGDFEVTVNNAVAGVRG